MIDCVFCNLIVADTYELNFQTHNCVGFEPLNPVTPGHFLVVPCEHGKDASWQPYAAARAMQAAFEYIAKKNIQANVITSIGPNATQTVFHTHVHIVPRTQNDQLHLPWTGQTR